ncbi:MAG TPA: nucleotidyl transferase AbiEii/AbiGii toxin family protein, partial [Erythrobacter sp.]|nr:nucleotidyl transferase AbiEii/AbiGii toxin family protein [Erythrobacter sp.]
ANGRMKDFYDLWAIPKSLEIGDKELDAAILATFERRETQVPKDRPPGLSSEMTENPDKQRQWAAYTASIELEKVSLSEVAEAIWSLVGPACKRISAARK